MAEYVCAVVQVGEQRFKSVPKHEAALEYRNLGYLVIRSTAFDSQSEFMDQIQANVTGLDSYQEVVNQFRKSNVEYKLTGVRLDADVPLEGLTRSPPRRLRTFD